VSAFKPRRDRKKSLCLELSKHKWTVSWRPE